MNAHFLLLALLLIWLHLAALAAALGPRLGSWAIGRACGVLLLVMPGFCLEHVIGFGALTGAWVPTAALASWYLVTRWPALKRTGFIGSEAVFAAVLAYGLLWKFCFPAISPTSERLTDLYFIGNYLRGDTLPPPDHWFPPYRFDFYYALQHYGAALLGRVLHLTPGATYNLAFVVLMALPATLAWDVAAHFLPRHAPRILLLAALLAGGTGASVFTHLVHAPDAAEAAQRDNALANSRMWGSARFIGNYDQTGNTAFARRWFPPMKRDDPALAELPMENYGYQFFVGDYHPPLAGFFLLALAIALIMALETSGAAVCRRTTLAQQAMLAFTVPAAIAANTWVYPLQLAMVGGWALWRQREAHGHRARGPAWFALAAGAGIGFALLFPFLSAFAARAVPTTLALVKIHSPFLPFVALMWPLLLLIGCGLLRKDTPRPTLFFTLLTAGLLLLSELVYIDDPSAGRYERTNTVMKWWGWIWTGGLIALGPPLLGAKQAWIRGATALAIGATLVYGVDIAHYFHATDMRFKGQLAGDGAYTEVPPVRDMFRYLGAVPDGIVLENVYGDAYHDGGAYAAFAAKPSLLGWTAHLRAWRGLDIEEIPQRAAQIRAFYRGDMPNPAAWLQTSDVRYVVWSVREAPDTAAWQRLASALEEDYAWHPFGHVGGQPVGIWVRR